MNIVGFQFLLAVYIVIAFVIVTLLMLIPLVFVALVYIAQFYNMITCGYFRETTKMNGKTVIVTGATGSIGKETVREIAKRQARVIMACRNLKNAYKVRDEIFMSTKNDNLVVKKLDLSSQKSIRAFAEDVLATEARLDVLIHNAATVENKVQCTEDGLELTMATNHYGPFLLTHLLIDLLKKSAPSRIIVVSSDIYRLTCLDLKYINPTSSYFPPYIYYPSKYANICFTLELARRLEGSGVTANCLHPGLIDSGIYRNIPAPLSWLVKIITKSFFKSPEQGCQTTVFLACSNRIKFLTGRYFMDCKIHSLTRSVSDPIKARKFWDLSKEYAKLLPTDPKI